MCLLRISSAEVCKSARFSNLDRLVQGFTLDPYFEKAFGLASIRTLWLATVLRNSLVLVITGHYDDLGKIAASLDMAARQNGLALSDEDRSTILEVPRRPVID